MVAHSPLRVKCLTALKKPAGVVTIMINYQRHHFQQGRTDGTENCYSDIRS
jgi:hypothetical protein